MALFRILRCFSQKWWNERERRRKSFNPISAFISRLQIKTPFKDFFSRFTLMDDGLKGELKDSSFSFLIYSVTTGTKSGKQNTLNSFSSYSRIPSEIAPVPTVKRSNIWPRHHHFFYILAPLSVCGMQHFLHFRAWLTVSLNLCFSYLSSPNSKKQNDEKLVGG